MCNYRNCFCFRVTNVWVGKYLRHFGTRVNRETSALLCVCSWHQWQGISPKTNIHSGLNDNGILSEDDPVIISGKYKSKLMNIYYNGLQWNCKNHQYFSKNDKQQEPLICSEAGESCPVAIFKLYVPETHTECPAIFRGSTCLSRWVGNDILICLVESNPVLYFHGNFIFK